MNRRTPRAGKAAGLHIGMVYNVAFDKALLQASLASWKGTLP